MVKFNGLENDLLKKLSEAPDDILSDISLIDVKIFFVFFKNLAG